jgi:hypothetical protein
MPRPARVAALPRRVVRTKLPIHFSQVALPGDTAPVHGVGWSALVQNAHRSRVCGRAPWAREKT